MNLCEFEASLVLQTKFYDNWGERERGGRGGGGAVSHKRKKLGYKSITFQDEISKYLFSHDCVFLRMSPCFSVSFSCLPNSRRFTETEAMGNRSVVGLF